MKRFLKVIISVFVVYAMTLNVSAAELQDKISSNNSVVLDKDYTDSITIEKGKNVTLDLNGYTLSGKIEVLGELTIKSSKEGGKVILEDRILVGSYSKDKETEKVTMTAGKFTLESGTIVSNKGYGILIKGASTAIVNGGEISSLYAAISSNNTTGPGYIEVNGGVLTTNKGPAIYLPSPGSVKITDGTINGGISLRMGNVDISGGVINAAKDNIDPFDEYYKYQGNAWLGDAIYVWGGAYTSLDEGYTSDLNLNITGGTINGVTGNAITIYDIGRVAQNISINISGNTKVVATDKNLAYSVVTLAEAGVKNIDAGYNNKDLVGKVKTTITGGTYSSTVAKYIDKEYTEAKEDSLYAVSKRKVTVDTPSVDETQKVTTVTVGVKKTDDLSNILLDSVLNTKLDLSEVSNTVVEVNVSNKKDTELVEDVLTKIKAAAEENKTTIATYFDIVLNVKDGDSDEVLGTLDELTNKIKFVIALPEDIASLADGYVRKYYIVRYHDGKAEILDASSDGKVVTFESDKFSSYALAYTDTKNTTPTEEENPKTGDNIIISVIAGAISITGLAFCLKKKYSKNN